MTRAELVVTDVTEMSGDSVCIAGLDLQHDCQVRLADPTPTRAQVRRWGGLAPGDIISVEYEPKRRPTPPHVEDARWRPETLQKLRDGADVLQAAAGRLAFSSPEAAFGAAWFRNGNRSAAWRPEKGERSLAWVRARYVRVVIADGGGLRLALRDADDNYFGSVPFQDLRVKSHRGRCDDCAQNLLGLARELYANACIVRVGLTRPFCSGALRDRVLVAGQPSPVLAARALRLGARLAVVRTGTCHTASSQGRNRGRYSARG